jgi:hypothetical protein
MSDNTTNIHDLPTDPAGGGSIGGGVAFSASENSSMNHQQQQQQQSNMNANNLSMSLDQSTINQIISGIQQAGGVTQLPSRDIPMNTEALTSDPNIQPNYIPPSSNNDYISMQQDNDDIINEYANNSKRTGTLDEIYEQLQTPLLLAVLYFLFQLPIFKKTLFKYLPFLFSTDGNSNLQGLLFVSVMYGFVYFITSRIMLNFNKF